MRKKFTDLEVFFLVLAANEFSSSTVGEYLLSTFG